MHDANDYLFLRAYYFCTHSTYEVPQQAEPDKKSMISMLMHSGDDPVIIEVLTYPHHAL